MALLHLALAFGLAAFADMLSPLGVLATFMIVFGVLRLSGDLFGIRRYALRVEYGVRFVIWFIGEIFKASFDVARLVLRRRMKTRPAVVAIRLKRADDGIATLIGALVTLTPGTLALDYDRDGQLMYVHALDADSHDAVERGVRRIEFRLLRWIDAGSATEDGA